MRQLTGYLATLDVLGFSELLHREGYSQQLKTYLDCINEVVRPSNVKAECVVFSDSIVLTSPGDNDEAFKGLVTTCSATFRALIRCEIPVRGAVAFGRYWREANSGSVFLAGRPIVEAYQRERASNWVGILLCPSVLHKQSGLVDATSVPEDSEFGVEPFDDSRLSLAFRLQPATVPYLDSDTHGFDELSGYAVVPLEADDDIETAARTVRSVQRALEDLRLKASQPGAQAKYRASLRWLEDVEKRFANARRARRQARKEAAQHRTAK